MRQLSKPAHDLKIATLSFLAFFGFLLPATQASAEVSQSPLLLPATNVPGSLALVPSVEYPTILSIANLGSYSSNNTYSGYFDPNKCYLYKYDSTSRTTTASQSENIGRDNQSWFYPSRAATNRKCNVGRERKEWSGNFLNWVGTPTIDPFRSALTGGHRFKDDTNLTVLQKARHDGSDSFGNRMTDSQGMLPSGEVAGATPLASNWTTVYIRLQNLNYDMLFSHWRDGIGGSNGSGTKTEEWIDYNPDNSAQWENNRLLRAYNVKTGSATQVKSIYRVALRVKVCDPNVGVEANCKQYGSNYKPEGLLQQYADKLRYSAFSYLNDSSSSRDGGVLRANQKYIGPTLSDGSTDNPNKEWSATTGIFVRNPDTAAATATGNGVVDSGVINYLNKFGSMTDRSHKSLDPVSELYYTALRYFKNQGNVSAYSSLNDNSQAERYKTADGFPVITDWNDPITYACQKNIILGIGDVNTHRDKNLPGATSSTGEPTKPTAVSDDTTVDVVAATAKVGQLEGVDLKQSSDAYTGRYNSAYIAGLAYDAHTRDIRPNMSGIQSVSTYWVDVREGQSLSSKANNQYWLAAKYGGFTVPDNFQPYSSSTTSSTITDAMWWTNGQTLSTGDKRPDNFFVASDAENMVNSLKQAFAQIVKETQSSTTSLASNSTQLETDSALYQSRFKSSDWSGDLQAKTINASGTVASTATWSAADKLDALGSVSDRKIFTSNTLVSRSSGAYFTSTTGANFTWAALDPGTKAALQSSGTGTSVNETTGADRLAYLRGDRSQEIDDDNPSRPFRQRGSRLGDIVNSDPQYIHKQDFGYNLLSGSAWGTVGNSYLSFRSSSAYQNRTPLVVVGANDGMLHGFNAGLGSSGGSELFAYVPRSIAGDLHALTDPNYTHRYYVDGTPAFSDAWIGNAWKTIVVGTTGAGGNSVFAIDVTAPGNMSSSNVLWEFTAPDMAYPIQKPSIVALANGKFGVIVSSGFVNTAVTTGHVWVLDAADGSVIKKFTMNTTGGMGEPLAVDLNNDRVADRIYVGDTVGNLWRLDINSSTPSSWDSPLKSGGNIAPLFMAKDGSNRAQPITAPLSAALNTDGAPIVVFGTGSFYQTSDTDLSQNRRIESFYGLIDKGSTITRNDLTEQKILAQTSISNSDNKGRVLSNNTLAANAKGWYLDLLWKQAEGGSNTLTGERVVSRPVLRSGVVSFTTLTPSDDPCSGGGTSWIMALNVFSGARLATNYFDVNNDGVVDENDYYIDADGNKIPYSGISDSQDGAIKTPSFFTSDTQDLICFIGSSGSTPQCSPIQSGARTSARISWREVNR